ncbi:MAG: type II toxin-antitoxin system ParD family antitoxin [Chloroflexota bacterium]|nr:type II toxin-antitoxin system ParD family antitoxin [Chloroflexota bacterium]
MNVLIDAASEIVIRERVESGRYPDAAAVVRDALRLLDERGRLEALRAELRIGLEQAERGEVVDFTPELLDALARDAERNARDGKPVRDVVKP